MNKTTVYKKMMCLSSPERYNGIKMVTFTRNDSSNRTSEATNKVASDAKSTSLYSIGIEPPIHSYSLHRVTSTNISLDNDEEDILTIGITSLGIRRK